MSALEDSLYAEFQLFGLELPVRQARFCDRMWRLDFFWPSRMVAAEIHGGIYAKKRMHHSFGAQQEGDFEKINEAIRRGISVYTFGPKWCHRSKRTAKASKALDFIWRVLRGTEPLQIVDVNIPASQNRRHKTMELFA